ncbi:lantibiotic dehydratase [Streptomyces sp. NPDC007346]|uniref:lantibiotic dehydratase n=1 Tax=Streptomyces sp. NPDC007346 TaxID=3154682 RepID=UPI0034537638
MTTLPHDVFDDDILASFDGAEATEEQLCDYIRRIVDNPALTEAMAVSSPDLTHTVEKVVAGEQVGAKRALRTAISVTRYARRMSGRPTPFGLYAGVARARYGSKARATLDGDAIKAVRPDAGWFDSLAREWLSRPHIRAATTVVTNNVFTERGGRLVVPHARTRSEPADDARTQRSQETSLRITPVLTWVRERAALPVRYAELLAAAGRRFPEFDEPKLDAFLHGLVLHDVLLTGLTAPRLDDAGLGRLAGALPAGSSEAAGLERLRGALRLYAETPLGEGHKAWHDLLLEVRSLHGGDRPASAAQVDLRTVTAPPQVDLRAPASVELPPSVTKEVERFTADLWAMTPPSEAYAHMRAYRLAFLDAYGAHGVVRLRDLVDPHKGLGYPQGYINPVSSAVFPSGARPHSAAADARTEALAALAHRGLAGGQHEVCLTDDDVRSLSSNSSHAPDSLEVCVQLLATSLPALESGDFSLWAVPTAGTLTAGSMAGRFAELTGSAADLGALLAGADPNALVAQVDFMPVLARAANVTQTPRLLEHVIPVAKHCDPAAPGHIDWRELLVAADGDMLRLYWERTGQEVLPVVPHVLSLTSGAPNPARLLAELRYTGDAKVWQPWHWGSLSSLPSLPRIRRGKSVLVPRTWRVGAALRAGADEREGWADAVAAWRARLGVRARINVGHYDQLSEIDLDSALQREMFRREVLNGASSVTESPRDLGDVYGWLNGHSSELTVPLLARKPSRGAAALPARPRRVLDATQIANGEGPGHPPGGEWAYVELRCVPEVHEELVTRHLPRLVQSVAEEIDRWFFIRYNHPAPQLRLRMRSKAGVFPAAAWKEVLDHCAMLRTQGWIADYSLPAYEPEYARYGGPAGMEAAERLFCADSEWTVNALRSTASGRLSLSRDLLVVAGYGVVLDALGSWDWPAWVTGTFPRQTIDRPSRDEVREASRIVVPGATEQHLAPLLAPEALTSLGRLAEAAHAMGPHILPGLGKHGRWVWQDGTVGALLHMHHNRLIGIDTGRETRSLTLLSHVARAHQGRARHVNKAARGAAV